jgi:hypothetical protein
VRTGEAVPVAGGADAGAAGLMRVWGRVARPASLAGRKSGPFWPHAPSSRMATEPVASLAAMGLTRIWLARIINILEL